MKQTSLKIKTWGNQSQEEQSTIK